MDGSDSLPRDAIATKTQRDPALERALLRPKYRLTVEEGTDRGRTYALALAHATGGRHARNDVVLSDPGVSGIHFEIALTDRGHLLRDLGSTNGTMLANHRVREVFLQNGSTFRVAATQLRYDVTDERESVDLSPNTRLGDLMGQTPTMREVFAKIHRVAQSEITVLLEGETGTGKELAARAIHDTSSRREGPFVVLDCGAIPPNLFEATLFGFERGAFTGAETRRTGVFEEANGGTLFMDEVGELPLDLQPKLLRVIESREIARVGSAARFRVDVRIVAATNRDLRAMVNENRFRADLYFRLAHARILLPPLRERTPDIAMLVEHFLVQAAGRFGRPAITMTPDAVEQLASRPWPGNVRELRAVVERAVALASGPQITRTELGTERKRAQSGVAVDVDIDHPFKEAKAELLERFEVEYLARIVEKFRGNLSRAARSAGLARNHLRRLLRRRGIPYQDL